MYVYDSLYVIITIGVLVYAGVYRYVVSYYSSSFQYCLHLYIYARYNPSDRGANERQTTRSVSKSKSRWGGVCGVCVGGVSVGGWFVTSKLTKGRNFETL